MKLKSIIIYGLTNWLGIIILSYILNPLKAERLARINVLIPTSIIISTTIIGILYIRTLNSHETLNGFKGGLIFLLINSICDLIFIIIPNNTALFFKDDRLHIISTIILIPTIVTILGYLAQKPIEVKK